MTNIVNRFRESKCFKYEKLVFDKIDKLSINTIEVDYFFYFLIKINNSLSNFIKKTLLM